MVADEIERLLDRVRLFDRLAALTTDARTMEAAREIAQECRVKVEQITAAITSNRTVQGGSLAP
jgi:hypothetical protein